MYDKETINSEKPFIQTSEWYRSMLDELKKYREYHMKKFLSCENYHEVGVLQGMIKATDDIINKLTRED